MEHSNYKTSKTNTQSISDNLNKKTIQNKAIALQDNRPASILQRKANNTGLPENLKSGIENLSGHSMDDVKVHYNSDKPAQLNAHAYAQGTDIHIASGQEKHLPHEAWHVVQQKQGRVKPTLQMKVKVNVNDDKGLEKEADVMGAKALQLASIKPHTISQKKFPKTTTNNLKSKQNTQLITSNNVIQRAVDLSTLSSTKNDLYYTVVGGGASLISKSAAPGPQPKPLYNVEDKVAINGDNLKVWKPRSKFADKKKLKGETLVYNTTGQVIKKHFDIQDKVLGDLMNEIELDIQNRKGDKDTRIGTAGMNDCKGYATTLKALIRKYGKNPTGLIGKSWLHETLPDKASFPYHGATVVAQDGSDAVTLEAHAGQELSVPVFHIRHGGKSGFEESNKKAYPGQYKDTSAESILISLQEASHIITTLKLAWTNNTQRSDKSAVKESPAIPNYLQRNWKKIAVLLLSIIVAFIAILHLSKDKSK
ncbi:DUF4157 domain-containing protein [Flavobacterium sp. MC2016-06]|jgi:hypothetical protein|uniref:eCIS core domain-containing protein n=1 Tax=Flavobacterium sp. MC2016-06 TaxID=2676308 RepID=UPI001C0DE678|nr:DUF4157 domain-containing protein [Flavobacterium sp. MC2016-06]MBU3857574.1 DUF4157 domain-containing protein [Flavobacterium sp. MC2016-06]